MSPLERKNTAKQDIEQLFEKLIDQYSFKEVEKVLNKLNLQTHEQVPVRTPMEEPSIECSLQNFAYGNESFLRTLSSNTQKAYKTETKLLLDYCNYTKKSGLINGSKSPITQLLNPLTLSSYLNQYTNSNTRNKKASFLRSFIKNSCEDFLSKPAYNRLFHRKGVLSVTTITEDLPKAFTDKQIIAMLEECRYTHNGLRNFTIINTFIYSGIRLDELVNLQIEDVDQRNNKILVRPKGRKNEKKQSRFIHQNGLQILTNYIDFIHGHEKDKLSNDEYNSKFIFSTSGDRAISVRTVQKMVEKLIEKLKGKGLVLEDQKLSVHSFRHSFAIYSLESGIDIYKISKLLGHKSITSTEVYLKMFDFQLKEAIENHPFAKLNLSIKGDHHDSRV
ncbi:site-specific integrase [Fictibacillus enclensis]|uniref:tyrosine-type recombinase/integrase n=1 Tax=Fictibacillus enclensis TaxID=1017270 RepID=UPI0025A2B905|nr:site-specific integrase [Fictibacillus enclensis]MDM5338513.1 site-specific integrase [Fictibacillus enclensis]